MRASPRSVPLACRAAAALAALLVSGAAGLAQCPMLPVLTGPVLLKDRGVPVAPPSVVQEIVFQGAKHLKTEELIRVTGIRTGQPLNPTANQAACQAIVRRYNEDGRVFASCELIEGGHSGDTRVVFQITEGPVVHADHIQFDGNTFVSDKRLANQVSSAHQQFYLSRGTFNPVDTDKDVAQLEAFYRSFGFDEVHVSREVKFDAEQGHAVLIFHIQEGPRHRSKDTSADGGRPE